MRHAINRAACCFSVSGCVSPPIRQALAVDAFEGVASRTFGLALGSQEIGFVGFNNLARAAKKMASFIMFRKSRRSETEELLRDLAFELILTNRKADAIMSQTAALQAVVTALSTAVTDVANKITSDTANFTPDADVTAAVTTLQGVVTTLQGLVAPATPPAA